LEKFQRLYLWTLHKLTGEGNFSCFLFNLLGIHANFGILQNMSSVELIQFFKGAPHFKLKSVALFAQVLIGVFLTIFLILQKIIAFPIDRGVIGVLSRVFGWKESELSKEVCLIYTEFNHFRQINCIYYY
jgi:hypothetical protein